MRKWTVRVVVKRLTLVLPALALVCWPPTVRAGPDFSVQAFVNAFTDPTGSQNVNTGLLPGPIATAGPIDLVSGNFEARIFAQAGYGHPPRS